MLDGDNKVLHKVGDPVYHSKWGTGKVVAVVGQEVDVDWPGIGRYRHAMSYVHPATDE